MRNTVIWSFFSIVALAGGGLLSGCDSDDAIAKSGAGESCDRTSDCADGLKCLEGTCYKSTPDGGNEGGADGTGGSSVVGPKPEVLGREGESCTKRSDCEDGLGCYSGRCTDDAGGEGGSGTAGPRLGHPGETCVTSSDCEKSLSCLPGGAAVEGPGFPGFGNIGVCSYGTSLTPSGKSCGAECREAADCCELPQALHVPYLQAAYGTGASSCSELRALLGSTNCNTATGEAGARCSALAKYCECEDDTWSCDAGACTYQGACEAPTAADQPDGCPTYTRSGRQLVNVTCNTEGACAPEPVDGVLCKRDADCFDDEMPVTNDPTNSAKTCSEDECVCHVESGACYRKCDNDLDCDAGYTCDADTSICTQAPQCTTNAECLNVVEHPNAVCDDGTCKVRCTTLYDCLYQGGEETSVCGPDNFCAPLGCSSDLECAQTGIGTSRIRMFCTENPEPVGGALQSAITD